MLEYISGQKNLTQLSHNNDDGYCDLNGANGINLFNVFALIDKVVIGQICFALVFNF